MSRETRIHLGPPDGNNGDSRDHLKHEFGRRVYAALLKRGMRQADLARASGLARDSISSYVRGRALPDPENLQALAKALNVEMTDLLPENQYKAIAADPPAFELKASVSNPEMTWIRVNTTVPSPIAAKIYELLVQAGDKKTPSGE